MSDYIYDGDYLTAQPHGTPRIVLPFSAQGDQSTISYEQDFVQRYDFFVPLSKNSIHPTDATAYLIGESELKPTNVGGVCMWTRRYSRIPASRDVGGSIAYQFPGIVISSTVRIPYVWTVACRTHLDFYLVGPNGTYPDVIHLPVIERQRYYVTPAPNGTIGSDTLTLSSAAVSPSTNPTSETYQGWIVAGVEIVAEASQYTQWQGNIWQRATKYVIAR